MALRKKLKLTSNCNNEINNTDGIGTSEFVTQHINNAGCSSNVSDIEILSKYFTISVCQQFLNIEIHLNYELQSLHFNEPVAAVYNPVEYAFNVHKDFVAKYLTGPKKVLFLGMNPGPYGMCQTGVPFGSVNEVRDWLQVSGQVSPPSYEIPARPVLGFDCKRTEISGKRFWGFFKELCAVPERFFNNAFVHNFCPLLLIKLTGANITPDELKGEERKRLAEICERWLIEILKCLQVEIIVGVGRFAEKKAVHAIKEYRYSPVPACKVVFLPHPSPRSVGNNNWSEVASAKLAELGLLQLF